MLESGLAVHRDDRDSYGGGGCGGLSAGSQGIDGGPDVCAAVQLREAPSPQSDVPDAHFAVSIEKIRKMEITRALKPNVHLTERRSFQRVKRSVPKARRKRLALLAAGVLFSIVGIYRLLNGAYMYAAEALVWGSSISGWLSITWLRLTIS